MADLIKWDETNKLEYEEWVASRPKVIQEMCKRFNPYELLRLTETGQLGWIGSYSENGTVTMIFLPELNWHREGRSVFGLKLDGLEKAEWPPADHKGAKGFFGDTQLYKDLKREGIIK